MDDNVITKLKNNPIMHMKNELRQIKHILIGKHTNKQKNAWSIEKAPIICTNNLLFLGDHNRNI